MGTEKIKQRGLQIPKKKRGPHLLAPPFKVGKGKKRDGKRSGKKLGMRRNFHITLGEPQEGKLLLAWGGGERSESSGEGR